jgi:hypothetical protein
LPARTTLLVDARNVLRSTWPNLGEEEVVTGSCAWAREHAANAVVVFDGEAPGGSPELDGCVVVGTGSNESADAWLIRESRRLRERSEPYWLVTSDRELRTLAGDGAERIIGGGSFAREISGSV